MNITKNSAKCTACDVEIESTHRHDFRVHYCKVAPSAGMKWVMLWGTGVMKLVPSGEETFRFGVDGGKAYLRRLGSGYRDTSEYTE